jgi:hypothetical protein
LNSTKILEIYRDKSYAQTKEYRQKMSESCKGIKRSEETKAKMRKPKTKEHVEAIRLAKEKKKLEKENG